ncbi:MAG: NTP transferase domain-containing protein [Gammaproteobacteria bacterium]|nr:NTP transferase domain-containing protein [Gammaproteobacteria bacterium]MDE2251139.1 NTP transferase domain-containing protein [Gammaproteobacteria bacterium]
MNAGSGCWALVLAGGNGTRLASLTTMDDGYTVPKQYCSLDGGPTLLQQALARATRVAGHERVCVVVAEQHRRHWEGSTHWPIPAHLCVQPHNRGTAAGILLGVHAIRARDPGADIVVFPSDHHVLDEAALAARAADALAELPGHPERCVLLGMRPSRADPQLGYILAHRSAGPASHPIRRFVEKPAADIARRLCAAGALWNSFIFAVRAATLEKLLHRACGRLAPRLSAAVSAAASREHLSSVYASAPSVDMSRDVLAHEVARLRVLEVPPCGWSDLGTPESVARTIARCGTSARLARPQPLSDAGPEQYRVNLRQRLRLTWCPGEDSNLHGVTR